MISFVLYATRSTSLLIIIFLFCLKKGFGQTTADTAFSGLVTIGNHELFVVMKGDLKSEITVVFESGGGGGAQDWTKVISLLPSSVRIIAYDRAGLGKSTAGPLPQTLAQNALELNELVKKLDVKTPIVLVAQSIGALITRFYVSQYRTTIAGVLFLDPTHESAVLGSMRYGGWTRIREKAVGVKVPSPQIAEKISVGYDSTADYMSEEFQQLYLAQQKEARPFAKLPLIVIGAGIRKQPPGTPDEQWKQLREERDEQVKQLSSLSENSIHFVDPKSGHSVQNDNPQLVAESILKIVEAIKSKKAISRL